MTKEEARQILVKHRSGVDVPAVLMQEAVHVAGTKRASRMRVPRLRDEVRERVNLVLMFNLGKALGQ